eukprot:g25967.t1
MTSLHFGLVGPELPQEGQLVFGGEVGLKCFHALLQQFVLGLYLGLLAMFGMVSTFVNATAPILLAMALHPISKKLLHESEASLQDEQEIIQSASPPVQKQDQPNICQQCEFIFCSKWGLKLGFRASAKCLQGVPVFKESHSRNSNNNADAPGDPSSAATGSSTLTRVHIPGLLPPGISTLGIATSKSPDPWPTSARIPPSRLCHCQVLLPPEVQALGLPLPGVLVLGTTTTTAAAFVKGYERMDLRLNNWKTKILYQPP